MRGTLIRVDMSVDFIVPDGYPAANGQTLEEFVNDLLNYPAGRAHATRDSLRVGGSEQYGPWRILGPVGVIEPTEGAGGVQPGGD